MKANYETLDEYLDALDGIKEKVAQETEGMNAQQAKEYFAAAPRALQEATGQTVRVRRRKRNRSTAKR
jgi:glycine cleavage system protein P-like pyridoxal-binding family